MEARAHLGMETQRQWNARAIARTTPALVSLYSVITLTAHLLIEKVETWVRSTAWYGKTHPTFAEVILGAAAVVGPYPCFNIPTGDRHDSNSTRIVERFTEASFGA